MVKLLHCDGFTYFSFHVISSPHVYNLCNVQYSETACYVDCNYFLSLYVNNFWENTTPMTFNLFHAADPQTSPSLTADTQGQKSINNSCTEQFS